MDLCSPLCNFLLVFYSLYIYQILQEAGTRYICYNVRYSLYCRIFSSLTLNKLLESQSICYLSFNYKREDNLIRRKQSSTVTFYLVKYIRTSLGCIHMCFSYFTVPSNVTCITARTRCFRYYIKIFSQVHCVTTLTTFV